MTRRARLVLCTIDGELLGTLPPVDVETPWWPDVEPVVVAAREVHGVDVLVLRLLDAAAPPEEMGGEVTYLAEVVGELPSGLHLEPIADPTAAMADDPLRAPYARPGGLAAIVAWADGVLERTGPPEQVKTWNLSSVLRLPTADGPVWCKTVPPFFAHEGTVVGLVGAADPALVPPLLGNDSTSHTALLGHVPGDDQFGATGARLLEMVTALVDLQARWADRVPVLLDAGLPDQRGPALVSAARSLVQRLDVRDVLDPDERAAADRLVAALPGRLADLDACGLPDTLVHGDFHPGNWRSDGRGLVLIDWGDSAVGHPLLDAAAFLPRVPEGERDAVRTTWAAAWRRARPGCDPERALGLIGPLAALRQALIYRTFLDAIEATEHRYHEADVPAWIRRAVRPTRPAP